MVECSDRVWLNAWMQTYDFIECRNQPDVMDYQHQRRRLAEMTTHTDLWAPSKTVGENFVISSFSQENNFRLWKFRQSSQRIGRFAWRRFLFLLRILSRLLLPPLPSLPSPISHPVPDISYRCCRWIRVGLPALNSTVQFSCWSFIDTSKQWITLNK